MSIIKHVALQNIVAHDLLYEPRICATKKAGWPVAREPGLDTWKASSLPSRWVQWLCSGFFFSEGDLSNLRRDATVTTFFCCLPQFLEENGIILIIK